MSLSIANLAKALGVRDTRPHDPYFRAPKPLPVWTVLDPIKRLLIIAVIVGVIIALLRALTL
jgi:hypothetical protein